MVINFFGTKIYVKKELIAIVLPIAVILIGFCIFLFSDSKDELIIQTSSKAVTSSKVIVEASPTGQPAKTSQPQEDIKVYVTGCVINPGIVTLKKGQIIDDAIKYAGGATEAADLNSVNLVYAIKENIMLYIKSKDEIKKPENATINQIWSQAGETGPGAEIISDSAGSVLTGASVNSSTPRKININTASVNDLDTLPGIGIETAKDIITYREKFGVFKSIKDIMKISGIKDSKYNKIQDFICID